MSAPLSIDVFPMRWGDMDALGHLNNTVYFRFCEEARLRWLQERGWGLRPGMESGAILAAASCQFRAQLKYPCDVLVETSLHKVGNSSFVLHHRIARNDAPDATAAEAESVVVWCDYAAGKSLTLPVSLRKQLTGAEI